MEIRSNIKSEMIEHCVARLKEMADEKSKSEEEERDRWIVSHPNYYSFTIASYYNQNPSFGDYGAGARCDISFYEWSDLSREPLKFGRYYELYRFLDESGISMDGTLNNLLRASDAFHLACKSGCTTLVGAADKETLVRLMQD